MGVNGAKTTPSALSSSMLPYLLGELLSKANEAIGTTLFGALTQHKLILITTREDRKKGLLTWSIE